MSEDLRKHVRTQGRYADSKLTKYRERKQKISPGAKESTEKKFHKRYSNESRGSNNSLSEEFESPVKYEEKSDYSFSELEEPKRPIEIRGCGKHVISNTENGESILFCEPRFLCKDEAWEFFECLETGTNWHNKNIVIRGKEYPQPRLVAWYGPYPYTYSGATLEAMEMPDTVLQIKSKVEQYLKEHDINATFNSVLLNLYRNGQDSVSWHSDDEMTMGICPTIASVSLGETRKFEMRPKGKYHEEGSALDKQDEYYVYLTHGSLVVMDGCMQEDWHHRVPKEYHEKGPRINLTFRTVFPIEKVPQGPSKELKKICVNNSDAIKTANTIKTINFDDENFPPLNSDVDPICSKHDNIHDRTKYSNSSMENNEDLNKSSEIYDNEKSFNNTKEIDNLTYDSNQKIDKIIDENCSSVEINSLENSINKSVSSPTYVADDEPPRRNFRFRRQENENNLSRKWDKEKKTSYYVQEEKPQKKWENEENPPSRWENEENPPKKWENEENPPSRWVREENKPMFREEIPVRQWRRNEKAMVRKEEPRALRKYDKHMFSEETRRFKKEDHLMFRKEKPVKKYVHEEHPPRKLSNEERRWYGEDNPVKEGVNEENPSRKFSNEERRLDRREEKLLLNAEAKEFIPRFIEKNSSVPEFDHVSLKDFVYYEVDLMHGVILQNYAQSLKSKIEEKLHEFNEAERDDLEFLCSITDGSQTDKNQKLISTRMCNILGQHQASVNNNNFNRSPHNHWNDSRKPRYNPRRH